MAIVSSLSHNLQLTPRINWTSGQEKSIVKDYPFTDLAQETPDQYVVRTYLQFLWLPESIMPLKLLIPSLKRVDIASESSQPEESRLHPLHDLLDPLIHTPRSAAQKYHMELPKILENRGGAGEIEETMMWYVLSYEKGYQEDEVIANNAIGVWEDARWRSDWLQRMEQREVQIQILLHFLLLSLPGPTPPPPPHPELSSVKKRKQIRKKTIPIPSTEDRLEVFMDKLSTWQLMVDLSSSPMNNESRDDDELDWMQAFSRDVVDPQFGCLLPEQCGLLRSKVFLQSPFTDDEEEEEEKTYTVRSSSPDPRPMKLSRTSNTTAQSAALNSRHPSPVLSSKGSRIDPKRNYSAKTSESRKLERSRSLSLSLAEEAEERRRAASTGPRRRLLTREVSMNRSFKNLAKVQQANAGSSQSAVKSLVEVRPIRSETNKDQGLTLVEATPAKPRKTRVRALSKAPLQLQSQTLVPDSPIKPLMRALSQASTTEEEEEELQLSSPFLPGEGYSDGESRLGSRNGSVIDTPMKPGKEP